jgi:hypothetical protein
MQHQGVLSTNVWTAGALACEKIGFQIRLSRSPDHARSTDHPISFTPVILTDRERRFSE